MKFIDKILYESTFTEKKLTYDIRKEILELINSIKIQFDTPSNEYGDCAIVSYELSKRLDKELGFSLYSVYVGEDEHVILYNKHTKEIIDPTARQFNLPTFSSKDDKHYKSFIKLNKKMLLDIVDETCTTLSHRNKRENIDKKNTEIIQKIFIKNNVPDEDFSLGESVIYLKLSFDYNIENLIKDLKKAGFKFSVSKRYSGSRLDFDISLYNFYTSIPKR